MRTKLKHAPNRKHISASEKLLQYARNSPPSLSASLQSTTDTAPGATTSLLSTESLSVFDELTEYDEQPEVLNPYWDYVAEQETITSEWASDCHDVQTKKQSLYSSSSNKKTVPPKQRKHPSIHGREKSSYQQRINRHLAKKMKTGSISPLAVEAVSKKQTVKKPLSKQISSEVSNISCTDDTSSLDIVSPNITNISTIALAQESDLSCLSSPLSESDTEVEEVDESDEVAEKRPLLTKTERGRKSKRTTKRQSVERKSTNMAKACCKLQTQLNRNDHNNNKGDSRSSSTNIVSKKESTAVDIGRKTPEIKSRINSIAVAAGIGRQTPSIHRKSRDGSRCRTSTSKSKLCRDDKGSKTFKCGRPKRGKSIERKSGSDGNKKLLTKAKMSKILSNSLNESRNNNNQNSNNSSPRRSKSWRRRNSVWESWTKNSWKCLERVAPNLSSSSRMTVIAGILVTVAAFLFLILMIQTD